MTTARRVGLVGLAVFLLAGSAAALDVEEVVRLAQAAVGDEVILAQMEADGSVFHLDAATIVRLKEAGVSSRVMEAMIRTGERQVAVAPPAEVRPVPAPAAPPIPGARAQGTLTFENQDDRTYSIRVEADSFSVFYYYGDSTDPSAVRPGETRSVAVPTGTYWIRWVGGDRVYRAQVLEGRETLAVSSGQQSPGVDSVVLRVVSPGVAAEGGTLKVFSRVSLEPAAPAVVTVRAPSYDTTCYQPRTVVYEQEYIPRTVVYRTPSYYQPHTYGGYRTSTYYPSGTYTTVRSEGRSRSNGMPGARTLVGAGLGAIIGHQYRERGKGAAIGAGAGYLLDQLLDR